MKQQLTERLQTLSAFLNEIEAINNNPYSAGLDIKKVITDLKGFIKETSDIVNQLPEESKEAEAPELASVEQ